MFKLFANGKVLQPDFSIQPASLLIQDDIIYDILSPGQTPLKPVDSEIDLEGQLIFPGLINSHDHLIETCWKSLGDVPVDNWYTWDSSMRASEEYKLLQKLSVTDLYVIGMYKNVVSGTTTVVDHFPAEVSATFARHELVSLLEHYYLAHSVSEHQLNWGRNAQEQFSQARGILPFIIHIGEGMSKEISEEIETLGRLGALGRNTVLVNGTFLHESDLQLIASNGSSMVWLPTSSQRIFGRQPDIRRILELEIPLTIGTDSSSSGSTSLLCELKSALNYSRETLEGALSAQDIVAMATSTAARVFGIEKNVGVLAPGKRANFVVFEDQEELDPFENFIGRKPENFSMVVHNGIMITGNDEYRKISSVDFSQYSEVRLNGVAKLIYGRPIQMLERIRHKLDQEIVFPFFDITAED
jgi:cytosine/adenosine deaminase-related metal-dependent hydrolase